MKIDPDPRIARGTKNIFADLGFPDAETHLLKAELVTGIQGAITAQELTEVAPAGRIGLSQLGIGPHRHQKHDRGRRRRPSATPQQQAGSTLETAVDRLLPLAKPHGHRDLYPRRGSPAG